MQFEEVFPSLFQHFNILWVVFCVLLKNFNGSESAWHLHTKEDSKATVKTVWLWHPWSAGSCIRRLCTSVMYILQCMWGWFYKLISALRTVQTISRVYVPNVIKACNILHWIETFKLVKENLSLQKVKEYVLKNSLTFYIMQTTIN